MFDITTFFSNPSMIRLLGPAAAVALSSCGAALGQGIAFHGSSSSLTRQDMSAQRIMQTMILGFALIESGAVLSLITAIAFVFSPITHPTYAVALTEVSVGVAVGISALCAGIASGFATSGAGYAIALNPLMAQRTTTFMLVLQSLAEAPIIFAMLIAFLIRSKLTGDMTLSQSVVYSASAITMGLGSIGPAIGQSIIAWKNLRTLGRNQDLYTRIFSLSLISEVFAETPLFFAFIIALRLAYVTAPATLLPIHALSYLGATLSSGLGGIGTATGAAWVSGHAAVAVAEQTDSYHVISRTALLSQVLIETGAIFAFAIAFLIV
jgi:F0F1-type ATP synthase membrane subunit c/vacuolar-type H+-ATPase subunit K